MRFLSFAFTVLAALPATAQIKCDSVFGGSATSLIDSLARFHVDIQSMNTPALQVKAREEFRIKFQEALELMGADARPAFLNRVAELQGKKTTETEKREKIMTDTHELLRQRTRRIEHEAQVLGPFANDSVFYTGHGDRLALYDFIEKKILWTDTSGLIVKDGTRMALSADGKTLLIANSQSDSAVMDVATRQVRPLDQLPRGAAANYNDATFSRNGKWIFIQENLNVKILDTATLERVDTRFEHFKYETHMVRETPDGRSALLLSRGEPQVIDMDTLQLKDLPKHQTGHGTRYNGDFSPDSKFYFFSPGLSYGQHKIHRMNMITGEVSDTGIKVLDGDITLTGDGKYMLITHDMETSGAHRPVTVVRLDDNSIVKYKVPNGDFQRPGYFELNQELGLLTFFDRRQTSNRNQEFVLWIFDLNRMEMSSYAQTLGGPEITPGWAGRLNPTGSSYFLHEARFNYSEHGPLIEIR